MCFFLFLCKNLKFFREVLGARYLFANYHWSNRCAFRIDVIRLRLTGKSMVRVFAQKLTFLINKIEHFEKKIKTRLEFIYFKL